MKTWHLLVALALCGAGLLLFIGCDDDSAEDAASGGYEEGDVVDEARGAGEQEMEDEGPIPRESFDQLKAQWDLQINGAKDSAAMLAKMNEEHKDQQMTTMLEQVNAKLAEAREKLDGATPQNGRQAMTVDIPRLMGEIGELNQQATLRIQEVLRSKIPGG